MTTNLNEMIEFLTIAAQKGFLNDNTTYARKTACKKFFDILEPGQKTVEYVRDNLDVIKARFMNLHKNINGNTVEEYARRIKLVLDDFTSWKKDRAAWEKSISARQNSRPINEGEKKARSQKTEATKKQSDDSKHTAAQETRLNTRVVKFPIRPDFEVSIEIPSEGLTTSELKKLLYFLLPYAQDWEPSQSPKSVFPMLDAA